MEHIIENMIIEWPEPKEDYRLVLVLIVLKAKGVVYVYDLTEKNANPRWLSIKNVCDDILAGNAQILRHDYIAEKALSIKKQLTDTELTIRGKRNPIIGPPIRPDEKGFLEKASQTETELAMRDKRYAILKPLIRPDEKGVLEEAFRRELFKDFRKQDREKYMRWLRDWWRLG